MSASVMTAPPPFDLRYVSLLWAGADRAGDIASLHARLFDPPWDVASLRASLDHPASTAFVATFGGPDKVVGFIIAQIAADEAEVLTAGVAPEVQKNGIGQQLVSGIARAVARAEVKRLFLEVAADNNAAGALYTKCGFKVTGRRAGYYERKDGTRADAIIMSLAL
jgi:[ribosomal protein S18]-alanine N-acetyltransferase